MFAKSLSHLEVRSELVWQNKGERSLRRAINSEEGGAAGPEGSVGPCPRLVSSAAGCPRPLPELWTGWLQLGPCWWQPFCPLSRISLGTLGCWVTCWQVRVTCTSQGPFPLGTRKFGYSFSKKSQSGTRPWELVMPGCTQAEGAQPPHYSGRVQGDLLLSTHGPDRYGHPVLQAGQNRKGGGWRVEGRYPTWVSSMLGSM